tara:strand:+ start:300 stop:521 length:222 start_codon:yes stop_codon:yes gene_type:complete
MSLTYLTTEQLAKKIQYHPRTIRHQLINNCLFEGQHYIRAFGRKKFLFIWEEVEKTMYLRSDIAIAMPMVEEI